MPPIIAVYAWHIYMLSPCFLLNFLLPHIFPFGRIFTPVCHFVYITLFRHFVYAILFKSLRLLRLHLMQVLPLPSLPAFITFGYYPDSGSVSAADNRVYAWHIYMLSPCFPVKFRTFLHIFCTFLAFSFALFKLFSYLCKVICMIVHKLQ